MTTIRDVRVILTAPDNISLVVVKVETSEPGLYGLGCATFTQRYLAVQTAIEHHLKPLLVGRDVSRIEELWQLMTGNAYWRNGPVLNNAVAGVDIALWDIKGKQANMPLYDLLGGKCREAAAVYRHASGHEPKQIEDSVRQLLETGVRHIRVQCGGYGGAGKGSVPEQYPMIPPDGSLTGKYYNPRAYMLATIGAIEHVRNTFGPTLEIIHDIHERLPPAMAVEFAKQMERYHLFFLEDALSPENLHWFAHIRNACTTPLAMGELFNHPLEWVPAITNRWIDFMRMHITQMGGITPAKKVANIGEAFGVRTAWHGPGDVSPVGHAANLHLDLASPNFGIQELSLPSARCEEVFPGCPQLRGAYYYPNDRPGLGIDIDETAAKKYPCKNEVVEWTQARLPDGGLHRA
jgi:mannonate dehydratase